MHFHNDYKTYLESLAFHIFGVLPFALFLPVVIIVLFYKKNKRYYDENTGNRHEEKRNTVMWFVYQITS